MQTSKPHARRASSEARVDLVQLGDHTLSGTTRVACVIGNPARHSLSPAIHNAAFAAAGVDASYIAIEIPSEEFGATLAALTRVGFLGASITMPYKELAFSHCATVGDTARRLGSLNTLVSSPSGLHGDSTDGQGCVGALRSVDCEPQGRRVAVLGAGATARACIVALDDAGVSDIVVVNRTVERAHEAAALAPAVARVGVESDIATCDVIVNTTPAGMAGNRDRVFDHGVISSGHVVLDAVYQPLETDLLASARAVGATCVDGLWMLVHQAVAQQVMWTGSAPDPAVLRDAAERELRRRHG